jgi:uncharacterized protein YbjQ (UPF0145 family)
MTPEQREELKKAALMVGKVTYRDPMTTREEFNRKSSPEGILFLIAQVEAGNRKTLELQRVYDERGLQIGRLEVALQRLRDQAEASAMPGQAIRDAQADAIMGFAHAMEEIGMFDVRLMTVAAGTAARIRGRPTAPTIPAAPGTKEAES